MPQDISKEELNKNANRSLTIILFVAVIISTIFMRFTERTLQDSPKNAPARRQDAEDVVELEPYINEEYKFEIGKDIKWDMNQFDYSYRDNGDDWPVLVTHFLNGEGGESLWNVNVYQTNLNAKELAETRFSGSTFLEKHVIQLGNTDGWEVIFKEPYSEYDKSHRRLFVIETETYTYTIESHNCFPIHRRSECDEVLSTFKVL